MELKRHALFTVLYRRNPENVLLLRQDTKSLEEKKVGVKGLGRKKTDESEHFFWKEDIKVPCGRLIASEHKDIPLEYNEYAVYDPKQVYVVWRYISSPSLDRSGLKVFRQVFKFYTKSNRCEF